MIHRLVVPLSSQEDHDIMVNEVQEILLSVRDLSPHIRFAARSMQQLLRLTSHMATQVPIPNLYKTVSTPAPSGEFVPWSPLVC